ncbi:type VI secretion system lysozyme-related protein [Methylocaldum marinum]|uniref:Type VI secretion system lysozyme-related protein n=1 Tax=Methylocaldum marinum TaxID=1432792 RepID=A0A250KNA2_9GAMM|nr:type VI secretion system baseplate subunit TssE [Methylocaldum marinum]BBA33145.1 type VI secretion system lysozyme-related protein [Methylocaldum marinum]
MADLTPKERLQPSLLDRLSDDAPDKQHESRDQRVMNIRNLRRSVLRDLAWLLNTTALESLVDLEKYPFVKRSVLNFGIPGLAGTPLSGADLPALERKVKQAVLDFEPRILADSVKVRVAASDNMNLKAMTFTIEGDLWAQPLPLHLYIRTEIDLDTGYARVTDLNG